MSIQTAVQSPCHVAFLHKSTLSGKAPVTKAQNRPQHGVDEGLWAPQRIHRETTRGAFPDLHQPVQSLSTALFFTTTEAPFPNLPPFPLQYRGAGTAHPPLLQLPLPLDHTGSLVEMQKRP